jgi:DNA polymerase-3 subunit alpha
MQIAQVLSGFSLGGADILRRAMGKKKPEEMAKQRTIFTEGAINNKIDESIATYVFDLMEKFAGYGFNKSHSAAYALVAYQTAWLKRHYPAAFMAAVFSSDMDNTDKVVILKDECKEMGLILYPPDINRSHCKFIVNDEDEIIYGLGAIKGVGEAAIEDLLKEREVHGAYKGLYDLCQRVELRKVNKRVLEALIKAGALDSIDANRAAHLAELPTAMRVAEQHGKMNQTGQNDLFGLAVKVDAGNDNEIYTTLVEPWTEKQRLEEERLTLGMYLTGHPLDQYQSELKYFSPTTIASHIADAQRSKSKIEGRVAGLVVEMRTRQTKKGTLMGFASVDDKTAKIEVAAFSKTFEQYRELLVKDALLVVEGGLAIDDFSGGLRLTAERIYTFEQAREYFAKCILIDLEKENFEDNQLIKQLTETLQPYKGGNCPVQIKYNNNYAKTSLQLGDDWRIHPAENLMVELKKLFLESAVSIYYR